MTSKMRDAIKIIEKRGWVQGQSEAKTGEVCGMAAVAMAHDVWSNGITDHKNENIDLFYADKVKLDEYVELKYDFRFFTEFNDSPKTTKKMVFDTLKAVAGA